MSMKMLILPFHGAWKTGPPALTVPLPKDGSQDLEKGIPGLQNEKDLSEIFSKRDRKRNLLM